MVLFVCFYVCFFYKIYKWIWIIRKQKFEASCPKETCLSTSQHYNPYSKDYSAVWRLKLTSWSIWINLATSLKSSISKWVRQTPVWIFSLDLSLSLICGHAGILLKQENLLKLSADSLNKRLSQAFDNLSMNWTEEHLHVLLSFSSVHHWNIASFLLDNKPKFYSLLQVEKYQQQKLTPTFPDISGMQ